LDTAIIVGLMIGSVVAIALVFGKTVLSVAWTGKVYCRWTAVQSGTQNKIVEGHPRGKNYDSTKKAFANLNKNKESEGFS
jgi:hypothetical protein